MLGLLALGWLFSRAKCLWKRTWQRHVLRRECSRKWFYSTIESLDSFSSGLEPSGNSILFPSVATSVVHSIQTESEHDYNLSQLTAKVMGWLCDHANYSAATTESACQRGTHLCRGGGASLSLPLQTNPT